MGKEDEAILVEELAKHPLEFLLIDNEQQQKEVAEKLQIISQKPKDIDCLRTALSDMLKETQSAIGQEEAEFQRRRDEDEQKVAIAAEEERQRRIQAQQLKLQRERDEQMKRGERNSSFDGKEGMNQQVNARSNPQFEQPRREQPNNQCPPPNPHSSQMGGMGQFRSLGALGGHFAGGARPALGGMTTGSGFGAGVGGGVGSGQSGFAGIRRQGGNFLGGNTGGMRTAGPSGMPIQPASMTSYAPSTRNEATVQQTPTLMPNNDRNPPHPPEMNNNQFDQRMPQNNFNYPNQQQNYQQNDQYMNQN